MNYSFLYRICFLLKTANPAWSQLFLNTTRSSVRNILHVLHEPWTPRRTMIRIWRLRIGRAVLWISREWHRRVVITIVATAWRLSVALLGRRTWVLLIVSVVIRIVCGDKVWRHVAVSRDSDLVHLFLDKMSFVLWRHVHSAFRLRSRVLRSARTDPPKLDVRRERDRLTKTVVRWIFICIASASVVELLRLLCAARIGILATMISRVMIRVVWFSGRWRRGVQVFVWIVRWWVYLLIVVLCWLMLRCLMLIIQSIITNFCWNIWRCGCKLRIPAFSVKTWPTFKPGWRVW